MNIRIVGISDTHNQHSKIIVPPCDVLIHAGDATSQGSFLDMISFAQWFDRQPGSYKIFVPGNHELTFEQMLPMSKLWFKDHAPSAHILIEDEVALYGGRLKLYGTPITPHFLSWAWNRYPDEIKTHWDRIPEGIDMLISHGPPKGILDTTSPGNQNLGCPQLLEAVKRIKPKYHLFGHIHGSGGQSHSEHGIEFRNMSVCNESYKPINPITILDIKI